MNVSAWCIRNPIAAIMFFVMLCFAGTLSYQNMKVQNFPDLEVPNIIITASLPALRPHS
jgi:multidrug efflux pump subunit AcrB